MLERKIAVLVTNNGLYGHVGTDGPFIVPAAFQRGDHQLILLPGDELRQTAVHIAARFAAQLTDMNGRSLSNGKHLGINIIAFQILVGFELHHRSCSPFVRIVCGHMRSMNGS